MKITHHTQLIQALIDKHGLKSYCEIGIFNPANNFDKINIPFKLGVDPDVEASNIASVTSDDYFTRRGLFPGIYEYGGKFDLIFIDGFHEKDQVKRDFENSLRCLSDNGFIVIHDTMPDREEYTRVPRITKKWYGNVYQFAMTLNQYEGIGFVTFNIDCGCTLVWKMPGKQPAPDLGKPMDWNTYTKIGSVLLNVQDEVNL